MPRLEGVSHDLCCLPVDIQVLKGQKVAANHPTSRVNDILHSALPLSLAVAATYQLVMEEVMRKVHCRSAPPLALAGAVHSLLCLLVEGANFLLPLEVLADDCSQEEEGLQLGWSCVPSEIHNHLLCF